MDPLDAFDRETRLFILALSVPFVLGVAASVLQYVGVCTFIGPF